MSVIKRNGNIFVLGLVFVHILHHRNRLFHQALPFQHIGFINFIVKFFGNLLGGKGQEFFFSYHRLGREHTEELHFKIVVIAVLLVFGNNQLTQIVHHIGDVHSQPVAKKGVAPFFVDYLALGIHNIIVLQQSFPDTEVVLFHLFLRPFDGFGNHGMLDNLAFFQPQSVHNSGHTSGAEHTHQVVFERNIKLRAPGVALPSCTSAQLAVDAPRIVPFGPDNGQSAGFHHTGPQLNVGTTTGHIGSNGHPACLSGLFNNLGFLKVQLGIQDIVFDMPSCKHLAEQFGSFHGGSTHQHRPFLLYQVFNFINNRSIFFAFGFVNQVIFVFPDYRLVGRNDHHIQFIDIPKLTGFRFGRTRHTGQFFVHPEVVLQGNGGIGLRSRFHFYVFLCLNGLVQPVGIAAAFHNTAGLLVNNFNLVVHYHVLHIFLKEGVGLQQLNHRMYTLRFDGVVVNHFVLFLQQVFFVQPHTLQFGNALANVGKDKKFGVVIRFCQQVNPFFRKIGGIVFFVDYKIEFIIDDVHIFGLFLQIKTFALLHQRFVPLFAKQFNQGMILRQSAVSPENQVTHLVQFFAFGIVFQHLPRIGNEMRHQIFLGIIQFLHIALQLVELVFFACRSRAGDNQRCTGIVN